MIPKPPWVLLLLLGSLLGIKRMKKILLSQKEMKNKNKSDLGNKGKNEAKPTQTRKI